MRELIFNHGVEISSPEILKCKNIEDLKRLNIFQSLPKDEQQSAYAELFGKIRISNKKEEVKENKDDSAG